MNISFSRSRKLTSERTHTGNGAPKTEKNLQGKGQTELSPQIPLVCNNEHVM